MLVTRTHGKLGQLKISFAILVFPWKRFRTSGLIDSFFFAMIPAFFFFGAVCCSINVSDALD